MSSIARTARATTKSRKTTIDTDRREPVRFRRMASPIGELVLAGEGDTLTHLRMEEQTHTPVSQPTWVEDPGAFAKAVDQLERYFAGELETFDLDLRLDGTDFQRRVWAGLQRIPYGTTWSYGQLAAEIGSAKAQRAVGLANGRNPIAIIVPCHRVIGANGTLTGFGGGLGRKRALLDLEQGLTRLSLATAETR